MQKLEEGNTYTPTDIPHVSSNCDLILNRTETSVHAVSTYGAAIRVCDVNWRNGLEETLSVIGLKTSSNNSDAALIATEHAKQNSSVPAVRVLHMRGKTLMPTTDKTEVYSAEVKLRSDMVKLNSERRQYRRARRSRKTWYRQPRFLNRKKPDGCYEY